jgi:hypothetical protein
MPRKEFISGMARKLLHVWAALLLCLALSGTVFGRDGKLVLSAAPGNDPYNVMRPILSISPKEVDLGTISPGVEASSTISLRNLGSGSMNWMISKPEGWFCTDDQMLKGNLESSIVPMRIMLKYVKANGEENSSRPKNHFGTMILSLTIENMTMTCRKEMMPGFYRESLKISSSGIVRSLFLKFKITPVDTEPILEVFPSRVDFGNISGNATVTKRLELANKGKDILRWTLKVAPNAQAGDQAGPARKGRYVSFMNEIVRGSRAYVLPTPLKDSVETFGLWSEDNGYPVAAAPNSTLRYQFSGTGISVLFWKGPDGGNLSAYIDDKFVSRAESLSEQKEEAEFAVVEGLPDGQHTLTLMSKEGHVAIEGVRILGKEFMKGPPGWLKAFPISGRTVRETDYITLTVNPQSMNPGSYTENILFTSNGGRKMVEVSVEVGLSNMPKILDVYRFVRGYDYFLTSNPQAEAKSIQAGNYQKQGIAFRLFIPGTPGTTNFHRWYNPQKGDRFYSYDLKGGGKSLNGYIYEGVIGNIGSSRLTGTKELYRWYNPSRGNHFYTTDPSGEGMRQKGYRFDGIAGYVR